MADGWMVVAIGGSYYTMSNDTAGTGPIQRRDREDMLAHTLLDLLSDGQPWIDRL